MKEQKQPPRPCVNEGCPRPAEPGTVRCDTCELEWGLFRRDLRPVAPAPRP